MSTVADRSKTSASSFDLAPSKQTDSGNLSETIFDSASQIDVDDWERVRGRSDIFLDLRLLYAIETSMVDSCRFRYLLYRDDLGIPVAIAVLCTFTIDIRVLANDRYTNWILGQLGRVSRKLVDYRILFCGLPLSACQSSLRFVPGANNAAILAKMDRTMRRIAKVDRASAIVLKEFDDDELLPLKPLEAFGYRKADSLPTYLVSLKGTTFDDYLTDVGKKKRHHIRQSMNKFAKSGLEIVTVSDFETIERLFTPQTHQLYEAVLAKSTTKFEHLPLQFFVEMARQLPDRCEFQFALNGETVVGFIISLRDGHSYRPLFVGMDYEINRQSDLYFNLLFKTVADGAAHRATSVEVGQNSDHFKRTKLGAVASARSIYVRGTGEILNGVIGLLFKQLFPSRSIPKDEHCE